jgi:hypothetical protein
MIARTAVEFRVKNNSACGAASAENTLERTTADSEKKLKKLIAAIAISESCPCCPRG